MENRCETIGKYILPLFRSSVSKELVVTHKLTQNQASEILGTTQAAISQYINSKRAIKGSKELAHMLPKIQEMARQTAEQLAKKQVTWSEVSYNFCKICSNMFDEDTNKTGDNYNI
jgi:predicted transcriptional regulator